MNWSPSSLLWGASGIVIGYLAAVYTPDKQQSYVDQVGSSIETLELHDGDVEEPRGLAAGHHIEWPGTNLPWEPAYNNETVFTTNTASQGFDLSEAADPVEYPTTVPVRNYPGKPRVRREWRTIPREKREMIGEAFRIMVNTTTMDGREKYNKHFWNYKDLTAFHVCAVVGELISLGASFSHNNVGMSCSTDTCCC